MGGAGDEVGMACVYLMFFRLCAVRCPSDLAAASLPPRRMGTLVVLMFHGVGRLVCTLSTPEGSINALFLVRKQDVPLYALCARVDLDVSISLSFVELACRSLVR